MDKEIEISQESEDKKLTVTNLDKRIRTIEQDLKDLQRLVFLLERAISKR